MKKILFTLLAIFSLTLITGCERPHRTSKKKKPHHTKTVSVHVLPNGRYVYNDNGIWYYYLWMNSSSPTVYSSHNNSYTYYTSTTSSAPLPSNGVWVPANDIASQSGPTVSMDISKPGEQLELDLGKIEQTPVVEAQIPVNDQNQVEAPTEQIGEQMEFNFESPTTESATETDTGTGPYAGDSSTDSSSSGSSDSGSSGDSGGGDSGGGDGGGGE